MAEDELIPELHDVGKLLDNDALTKVIPGWPATRGGHTFTINGRQLVDLAAFKLPRPSGPTWFGVTNHHERTPRGAQISDPNTGPWRGDPHAQAIAHDLILLMAADHLAASTSRAVEQEHDSTGDTWPELKSQARWCLWRDRDASARSSLLSTREELAELLQICCEGATALKRFTTRYGELLRAVPEEKGFPRAVTTLKTHLDLVGRYYRICRRYSNFERRQGRTALWYGRDWALSCDDVEKKWRFRLARCRIQIPGQPARLRDLGIFHRLEAALDTLLADPDRRDHVLLTTFQSLLLFLPLEEIRSISDVLAPLVEAGFQVESDIREAPLTTLTEWGRSDDGASLTHHYLQSELAASITPPLCEVCQLAAGEVRWQRRSDDVVEYLCRLCAETRDRFSQRFAHLEDWTEGYTAWLRVSLDQMALERHLRCLFERYVSAKGAGVIDADEATHLVSGLRTTALMADYTEDFGSMLNTVIQRLRQEFGASNVETLAGERKELSLVRLDRESDALRLVEACHAAVREHFPQSLAEPPVRVAISVAPIRFPFAEHRRLLDLANGEVTMFLAGRGRLAVRLEVVPELVALARSGGQNRRGLYRLADIAAQSPALARVALDLREEQDLAGVASALRRLGLDFDGMATFARLTRD